jgi:DNA-binding NarL/FixJ family response regulator
MKKILIVDDDRDIQVVLSDLVKSEGYDACVAGNGQAALKKISTHSPDLILLDIRLPGIDGMSLLEKIRKVDDALCVVMLTGYGDIKDAVKAIKLGAFDYITKPFDNDEIMEIIRFALSSKKQGAGQNTASLSFREKEVLSWLKRGKSSADISILLDISERTVNFHVKNIMKKLDAVTRTQAVATAIEQGLTEPE